MLNCKIIYRKYISPDFFMQPTASVGNIGLVILVIARHPIGGFEMIRYIVKKIGVLMENCKRNNIVFSFGTLILQNKLPVQAADINRGYFIYQLFR